MDLAKSFESRAQFERFNTDDMPSTLSDTIGAAFTLAHREERISSAANAWRDKNDARAKTIAELGGNESLVIDYGNMLPEHRAMFREAERDGTLQQNPFWRGMGARRRLAYEHVRDFERRFPDQVPDDQQILDDFKAEAAELRVGEQFTIKRGSGLGAFLGTGAAIMTDPLILLSLGVGAEFGAGRTALATIGRAAAIEGSVAVLAEIPIQTEVLRFKRELDSPWSFRQSALNVLAAGGGGVVLGGAIGGGVVGARRGLAAYRAAKEAGEVTPTQALDEAEQILEDTLALHDENPLGTKEFPADAAHERAFEEARTQHADGEQVDVRETVEFLEPDDGINRVLERSDDPGELVSIDPREIEVDAKTFQFKSGTDAAGVNDTLRGVKQFDQRLAGVSLVWEQADGKRFIVDGHQRRELGIRAIAGGQDPDTVKLNAFILREADGVTAIDARRMAAIKNMAEGTGSALDAAKILRDVGRMGESILPPMPPNSALVRQARGLANLGEDEFLQVVNGVIPERFGALVGAATAEPKLQQAMIGVLRRTKPANETQARAIVDQVRTVGTETRVTEDLFGEQQVTESLYLERAQVLDAALRESRKDKTVFGRLLSEEARITEGGENILDRAANFERLQEAKDAQAKISRLANTKGPISEALTEAARQVKGGKKPAAVIEAFLESVRRTLLEGDRRGRQAGRARPGRDQASIKRDLITARAREDAPIPDTRGQGVQYHGTSRAIEKIGEGHYETLNIYGQGLYTTDALDIAAGYARKRGGKSPTIYEVNENKSLQFYDIEQPIDDDLAAFLREQAERDELIDLALEAEPPNLRALYDEMRDVSRDLEVPADEVQELFDIIALHLENRGFAGMTHIGGLIQNKPAHKVKIYFRPENDISVTDIKFVPSKRRAPDTVLNDQSITSKVAKKAKAEEPTAAAKKAAPAREFQQQQNMLPPAVDAAPRSIVRALEDSPAPSPDATRTGTVPDTEYDAVLAQAETIIDDQGALATVSREVNGELETRTLRAELEALDALEDTIERIRICSATKRAA
jgi:hypothetical protein